MANNWRSDLQAELIRVGQLEPGVKTAEDRFALWYLLASVTDDVRAAADAVTNGPGDGGLDAVFIDDSSRVVHLVQVKYHGPGAKAVLPPGELTKLERWVVPIAKGGAPKLIDTYATREEARSLAHKARAKVRAGYALRLSVVTTGSSAARQNQIRSISRDVKNVAVFEVLDLKKVSLLFHAWQEGATPLLGEVTLDVGGSESLGYVEHHEGIEATVVSIAGKALALLYERFGDRLFARNIRGYQGKSDVNDGIATAVAKRPGRFFFLNNGITILADRAEMRGPVRRRRLWLLNPQIVNGQQTTRTIAAQGKRASKVSVLAKVVTLPSYGDAHRDKLESLLSDIVRASNFQNKVSASDLISNDGRQIRLERELLPLGFGYQRKKMTRADANRHFGGRHLFSLKKTSLAYAVAATFLDPADVRKGESYLFETHYDDIFSLSSPYDYLARWRLFEACSRVSKSRPEWGYAKWAVIHVAWHVLLPALKAPIHRRKWTELHANKKGALAKTTETFLRALFREAMKLHKAIRSKGQDVSNFYKNRHGLHEALGKRIPKRLSSSFARRVLELVEAD